MILFSQNRKSPLSREASYLLDLFRVIAVQMVLLGHSIGRFELFPQYIGVSGFPYIALIGVIIFFLLSGFLITYSVDNRVGLTFREYFIRRFVRIYSAFLPCLLIIAIVDYWHLHWFPDYFTKEHYVDNYSLTTWFQNLFMLNNAAVFHLYPEPVKLFFAGAQFGSGRPLWTLSLEWWIYMFFGALVFWSGRVRRQPIWALAIIAMGWVTFASMFGSYAGGLAFIWFFGCIAYIILHSRETERLKPVTWIGLWIIFSCLTVLCFLATRILQGNFNPYDFRFMLLLTLAGISLLGWFMYYPETTKRWVLFPKTVKVMANYSFTLYLLHYTFCSLFAAAFNGKYPAILLVAFSLVLNNVVAFIVASTTEFHHKRLTRWVLKKWC